MRGVRAEFPEQSTENIGVCLPSASSQLSVFPAKERRVDYQHARLKKKADEKSHPPLKKISREVGTARK